MNITRDHTPNTAVPFYGHGIECLDMQGRLTTIPGTVPLSLRKRVKPSCLKPWRGDRELDPIGKYDPTLEVDPLPHDVEITSLKPEWWFAKHGDYPHACSIAAVKQFFGFSVEDKRKLFESAPKSKDKPARYDLFIVREYLKEKGVI